MEKKSIGSFLAALRKASGLTQEEVAQKLFVSNKTVSKWERDESSPELALIPVLAELFQVTCDDILRGERVEKEPGNDEKARAKTGKQVQRIITHTENQFKSVSCIAAALTVLGLVCHFVVAYTYFKPLIAFGLGFAFLLGSVVLEMTQLIRTKAMLQDGANLGEGFFSPDSITVLLHRIAFIVFMLNTWAGILIWPMVAAQGLDYANSVVSFGTYLSHLPMLMVICLAVAALAAYFARRWLDVGIDEKSVIATVRYKTGMIRRMAWMQGVFLLGVAILFLIPPAIFVLTGSYEVFVGILFLAVLIAILATVVVNFVRTLRRSNDLLERLLILLLSIRNVLYGVSIVTVLNHISVFVSDSDPRPRWSFNDNGIVSAASLQIILITIVYLIIKYFLVKKHKGEIERHIVS